MTHTPRKRRTVLWLFTEDYEFLERIADADGETKSASIHRLVRALRLRRVTTFRALESVLAAAQDKDGASRTSAG